jgi:superfamily II DNA or RNA helicase
MMVLGLHGDHHTALYEKYGVFAPNYFHRPTYKLGRWDGKIRFFHKDGKTFLYLIDEILPQLVRMGYKIAVEDLRQTVISTPQLVTDDMFIEVMHPDTGKPIELRPDQVTGVNALIEHGNGVCVAGTGAGKTFMCAALVQAYNNENIKTLTIVPDGTLIRQTKRDYILVGLDTGEYSGTEKTLDHRHVVSTWQALKNNPSVVLMFDMIIVDECHGLRGNVLTDILTQHAAKIPYRFGFTGTLPKDDTDLLAVHVAVGPVRHTMPAHELIEMGVLSNLHIDVLQLKEDVTQQYKEFCDTECIGNPPSYEVFKAGYFPDYASERSHLQAHSERIQWIADLIETKRDMKKGNVLCLVSSIPVARKLKKLIKGAHVVNGADVKTISDRQKIYDLFKDNDDLVVIATVHIAGTGLSINRIFNLILVDIGKSFIRVIQAIGRGLRKAHDKSYVSVTDICSDFKYSKQHLTTRVKYYKDAKYPFKKHTVDYIMPK